MPSRDIKIGVTKKAIARGAILASIFQDAFVVSEFFKMDRDLN